MSRPTRDGTSEPVSRDQIFRHARGQENIHFPYSADYEQDWQPSRLIHTLLYVMTIHTHTYIHIYIHVRGTRSIPVAFNGFTAQATLHTIGTPL